MGKKYWLKLGAYFLKESHMIYLKSQKNGFQYIYLWQSLLLKSLEVDEEKEIGFLRLNEKIPYSPELLSEIFGMEIDTVKIGIDIFANLGMIEILEDGTIYIEAVQKMIGRESESAERVRLHRKRKEEMKLLRCNDDVTESNPIENKNKNKNKREDAVTDSRNTIPPSPEVVQEYLKERNITRFTGQQFCDWYATRGWKVGREKMKDWQAAVRTWESRDNGKIDPRDAEEERRKAVLRRNGIEC